MVLKITSMLEWKFDTSAQAYGAVAYFVFSNKDYKQNIRSFILSELRLSPLKEQCSITIPELELQEAVLAVRSKCTILEEIDFDIHKIRFWTDSKITLTLTLTLTRVILEIRLKDLR